MTIPNGTRLGAYEIGGLLGAGGMGEVYRARDARLGRDVALKVLPADVATDADRRARFEREARAIAALSHPNILALFDIGLDGDRLFVVTELLEGQTLADRLREGPLPPRKAVEIAVAIARGLAAAHDKGIAHRDMKPANVFLLADGQVKLLDFGLARETSAVSGATETRVALTDPGTILGTAGYMAPEQIRGQAADGRADLFALGVVLHEMLTGKNAFVRETTVETLNSILKDDPPDVTASHAGINPALERIVRHAMEKNPAERFQTARDVAFALEALSGSGSSAALPGAVVVPATRRLRLAVVALAGAAAGAALAVLALPAPAPSRPFERLTPFAVNEGVEGSPAWSPDGSALAYVAEVNGVSQVFARQLSKPTATQLTNLDANCESPQWDDAGRRVLFIANGTIFSVGAAGGQPDRLVDNVGSMHVLRGQGTVVFQRLRTDSGESRFIFDGSERSALLQVETAGGAARPFPLPDLSAVGSVSDSELAGVSLSPRGTRVLVGKVDSFGMRPESLWTGATEGPLRRLPIRLPPAAGDGASVRDPQWFDDDRRLVFRLARRANDQSLWILDSETGATSALYESTEIAFSPAPSPDGASVAFGSSAFDWNIHEVELTSGRMHPVVAGARYDGWPDWLADGTGLVFTSLRRGRAEIWRRDVASRADDLVVSADEFPGEITYVLSASAVSPDGRRLAYQRFGPQTRIFISSMIGSTPVPLTANYLAREDSPSWSPDGQWIAFARNTRVYKTRADGGDDGIEIAAGYTGLQAGLRWSPVDDRIGFETADGLMEVPAGGGTPRRITAVPLVTWNWSPDGTSILALRAGVDRQVDLVRIDAATGALQSIARIGAAIVSPDPKMYELTHRSLQVSPDGKRVLIAILDPRSDISILEGLPLQPSGWLAGLRRRFGR